MNDPYLYKGTTTLRNLLNILNEKELELAEAEISRANMMLLYEEGFADFTADGIKKIHKALFGDVYDWAGEYRIINVIKREKLLVGKSVWYANCEEIEHDLEKGWEKINDIDWAKQDREGFAKSLANAFPSLWQAHPFRDGNTRTIVMLMTFFVEHHGFHFDQELFAASAGYVRDAFVLACWGEYSEYEHLEKILFDSISDQSIPQTNVIDDTYDKERAAKHEKYKIEDYERTPHEYRPDEYEPD